MTTERIETTLRFSGEWPWWLGCGGALVLGALAWMLYARELGRFSFVVRAGVPLLRASAVAMIFLMLSGPVLHHRITIGELSRLVLFVDSSKSMGLTDRHMDLGRKVLLLQQMKQLPESLNIPTQFTRIAEALMEAHGLAVSLKGEPPSEERWKKTSESFISLTGEVRELFVQAGAEQERLDRYAKELYDPARSIVGRPARQEEERKAVARDLSRLADTCARWAAEAADEFSRKVGDLAKEPGSQLDTAIARFDTVPRWQRLQSLLMDGGEKSVLAQLAARHDVQVVELAGRDAHKIWEPRGNAGAKLAALPQPVGETTDLSTGVKSNAAALGEGQKAMMVLFSDGQHVEGESPAEAAKVIGARGIPIFTVGVGSHTRPRDMALVKAELPDAVFHQDRIRGSLIIKDDVPPGVGFTVSIKNGETVVWETSLTSERSGIREVPFDFDVGPLTEGKLIASQNAGLQATTFPVTLKASVSVVDGESEPANNDKDIRFRAVTQKRKVLILDGRPRWETRYLRNLFGRDEQWEVNCVVAAAKPGENGFQRGEEPEQFPPDQKLLDGYDLIFFGEVPRDLWKPEELQWLADFVAKRGGAMVFIDGARARLQEYAETPLGAVIPVKWKDRMGSREPLTRISLTERSQSLAAFSLAPSPDANTSAWTKLPPPHWVGLVEPLPGAETLLNAEIGDRKVPVMVHRAYGAGKVVYQGFDESWRWRYEVADQYHVKFWNQIANWSAELPFAVRDKLVSLDAGGLTHEPGESADIRVRLRDGEGRPVSNAAVDAVLARDGRRVATIRLMPDESGSGLFRGRTAGLEPGSYEVTVDSAAIASQDAKAKVEFTVESRDTGELTLLNCNEELLRATAQASAGTYLREENLSKLVKLLEPMSMGRVSERDTPLRESFWWFIPIIFFFSLEWFFRKRLGLL